MALAKRVAQATSHGWARHSAVVMKGGAVLSMASNTPSAHAEQRALDRLWASRRRGARVLSVRVNARGEFALARPCAGCMAYLRANGVTTVTYTTDAGVLEMVRVGRA